MFWDAGDRTGKCEGGMEKQDGKDDEIYMFVGPVSKKNIWASTLPTNRF